MTNADWCAVCDNTASGIRVWDDIGNSSSQRSIVVKTTGYQNHTFSFVGLCYTENFDDPFEGPVQTITKELWENGEPANILWFIIGCAVAFGIVLFSAALAGILVLANHFKQKSKKQDEEEDQSFLLSQCAKAIHHPNEAIN